MVNHLVESHRKRVALSLNNAAKRITHQQDIDSSRIENPRKGIVVGGKTSDLFPSLFHLGDCRNRDLVCHCSLLRKQKGLPDKAVRPAAERARSLFPIAPVGHPSQSRLSGSMRYVMLRP